MLFVLFVSGCANQEFITPDGCSADNSIILQVTNGNPITLSNALLVINIIAIEKLDNYSVDDARTLLSAIRAKVNSGITYRDLYYEIVRKVSDANSSAGSTIFMLAPKFVSISDIGGNKLLSDCDVQLINRHLDEHESVLIF
jgi:hypothetical protein